MGRRILSVIIAMQFLTACSGNSSSSGSPFLPGPPAPPPSILSNLKINTDNPLEYSISNMTSPTNATGLNLAMPTGGSNMASCIGTYNPTTLPVVNNTLPVAPYSPANLARALDLTQDQTVHFGVTSTPGALSFCYGAGLLFGVSCSLAGFTASLASMLASGGGDLWIVGSDGYGSNTLTARKWINTFGADIMGSTTSDGAHIIGVYRNNVYFSSNIGGVIKLYRTDGTSVQQVTQFNAAGVSDNIGSTGIEFQGNFYFTATTGSGAYTTLYRLKPNDTVERVSADSLGTNAAFKYHFAIYNNNLYFAGLVGDPALGNVKLIRFNGSSFCQASNIIGAGSDAISDLSTNNNKLYFIAQSGSENAVMSYDGTSINRLTNTYPGGDDLINRYVNVGTSLFLSARNNSGFTKLFEITTTQVIQTSNMAGSSANDDVVPMSNYANLFFTANNGSNIKLYTINNAEIVQISNVNTGDDVFTPIAHHDMPPGDLFAQFTNSSGQGVLTKISLQYLEGYTNPTWYQTVTGYASGVSEFGGIARVGYRYMYQNTVTNAAPPGVNSKIYLMKHQ